VNYKETLKEAEFFMEKTNIRDLCTNFCKGKCCARCYASEDSCKGEERRLSCSVWLCGELKDILQPELNNYYGIIDRIEEGLVKAGQKCNIYHNRPPQNLKDKFLFQKEELFTNEEKIEAIRRKVYSLICLFNKMRG